MPDSDGPDPAEADVIELFRTRARPLEGLLLGIGDDAALFSDGRVVTVDTMVDGVHWDARLEPEDVGWKLVAVNVSDIAAMGARPEWCVLSVSLPSPLDLRWTERFAAGLVAACDRWGVALVGGDTTRGAVRSATLTMAGRASRPIPRSGGRPGDDVWVTGELGLAAEGFLAGTPRAEALVRLRRPEPRLELAVSFADAGLVTAMMDLSDGLRADLARLCAASGCGATVDPGAIPGEGPLSWRVAFGEDYELLFAAPADRRDALRSLATMHRTRIARIGRLEAASGLRLRDGTDWPVPLFAHFAPPSGARASPRGDA